MAMEPAFTVTQFKAFVERKGHHNTDNEHKQRHNQIFKTKSFPFYMRKLCIYPLCCGIVKYVMQTVEDSTATDNPEHIETTECVN
jgi:hypothetical protein